MRYFDTLVKIDGYDILKIDLKENIRTEELKNILDEAKFILKKGRYNDFLVISGKGPIWLYCSLVNEFAHVYKAIATFDPKLNRAVVVSSHSKYNVGDTIEVSEDMLKYLL